MPEYKLVRHRGKFAVSFTDEAGKRQRRSLGTDDKNVAKTMLASFQRERKFAISGKQLTMEAVFEAYVTDREDAGKSTVPRMKDAWKRLKSTFANLHPSVVTEGTCRGYIKDRNKQGASNGTIHTELGYLRAAAELAARKNWIDKAPNIVLPSKPPPKEHHLTMPEAVKLIKAAVRPHVRLFIILALTTAGRVSAILQLTWDRIDFEGRKIDLRDPTREATAKGRARPPMNETAFKALKEAHRMALSDYVVEWSGQPVKSIKRGVAAAARRAGVNATPHVLRHTAAVWMAQNGVSMAEIAQFLGHTNPAVTFRTYARFSPEYLQNAAKSLDIDLD